MPAVGNAGGGDEVRLEDGFTPSVAGTVDSHAVTTTKGAAAVGFPAVPDGMDPYSAAVAGAMATWPEEREAVMALTGKKSGHLGAAASATDSMLKGADAENATSFEGIGKTDAARDASP